MNYIYVGKIVNTHALKGEVRLISNFDFKSRIFKKDNVVYVGENKDKLVIETYRTHKQFDMLKFVGIDYINDVLKYKGCNVYIDEDSLKLNDNEILTSDLVNYDVYSNDKLIGRISEYRCDNGNKMIRINGKFIPYNDDFIVKYDKINKRIYFKDIEVFL